MLCPTSAKEVDVDDINLAVADYISRSEPNDAIKMVNISDFLEARKSAGLKQTAGTNKVISDALISKLIQQGIQSGVFKVPSKTDKTTQGTNNATTGSGNNTLGPEGTLKRPLGIRPPVYSRVAGKQYQGASAVFACLQKCLGPLVINTGCYAFPSADFGNRLLTSETFENNADFLISGFAKKT